MDDEIQFGLEPNPDLNIVLLEKVLAGSDILRREEEHKNIRIFDSTVCYNGYIFLEICDTKQIYVNSIPKDDKYFNSFDKYFETDCT